MKAIWIVVGGAAAISLFGSLHHSGGGTTATDASGGNVWVDTDNSWCTPTGVDDIYTGDGHVTFYVTLHNDGGDSKSVDVTPVRHYDDGGLNESPMDTMTQEVAAGDIARFRSTALVYKAHSHDVTGCGLIIDGGDEVAISVR